MSDSEHNEKSVISGALYLVATPIGNLDDITIRALNILRDSDRILAEDTRHTGVLLAHYGIKTPQTSYHEHNKRSKLPVILDWLESGEALALVTDAGTPGISDPGEELVQACVSKGIQVFSIPGAAAAICAVTSSGLSCRRFAFEAFLPKKKQKRQQILSELAAETRTIILYEAPHHLAATVRELYEALGDRQAVFCRELTKRYEEKLALSLGQACSYYEEHEPRGEFVIVIEGAAPDQIASSTAKQWSDVSMEEHMNIYLEQGIDRRDAMKRVAADRGISKRQVYDYLYK